MKKRGKRKINETLRKVVYDFLTPPLSLIIIHAFRHGVVAVMLSNEEMKFLRPRSLLVPVP